MAIEFEVWQYEFAHGRRPRGEGNWGFEFVACAVSLDGDGPSTRLEFAPGCILYSAAKKWARARARELGAYKIRVAT